LQLFSLFIEALKWVKLNFSQDEVFNYN